MGRKVMVLSMGQSPENCETNDIYATLSKTCNVKLRGILDDITEKELNLLAPAQGERFIVTALRDGREIRVAERIAMHKVNDCLIEAEQNGASAAMILCTGHFEIPPLQMLVFTPERILLSLLRSMGVRKLGAIVPKVEQIKATEEYYKEFSPCIRAASPYGAKETIAEIAKEFRDSDIDLLMTDCMGFTKELGELIQHVAGKNVLVPRVVLPALMEAVVS